MKKFEEWKEKRNIEISDLNKRKGPWMIQGPNGFKHLVKIQSFVESFVEKQFHGRSFTMTFLTYNDMSISFLLEVRRKKYLIRVGQPNNPYGTLRIQYDNLSEFHVEDKDHVIEVDNYYTDGTYELYVENYQEEARILVQKRLDCMREYLLNDIYSYEGFHSPSKEIIQKAIVAVLVSTYHEDLKAGIGEIKLTNGDFLMDRKIESWELNEENVANHMKLCAARTLLPMSFEEYQVLICREFARASKKGNILHTSGNIYFENEELEDGIALGLFLKRNRR